MEKPAEVLEFFRIKITGTLIVFCRHILQFIAEMLNVNTYAASEPSMVLAAVVLHQTRPS